METPIAMEPWQWRMHSLCTARSLNRFSIWCTTVLLQHFNYIYGNTYCNGTLTANTARAPNSTYTQLILNLICDSATQAYICIYGKIYCNWTLTVNTAITPNSICTGWIFNFLYDSSTAASIYIYGNTYCNWTFAANNALTWNSMFTQSILDLVCNRAIAA